MSKLILVAIRERKVTIILSIMILVYGFYVYYGMPRQENPDTSSPAVQILAVFPGANAKTVEEQVAKKIEDEMSVLDGIDTIRSYAQDNVAVVVVMLGDDVDYDEQWDKMRVALARLQNEMPEGVMPFDIDTDMTSSSGLIIALNSETYDAQLLNKIAQRFKDEVSLVDGVKKVEISGVPQLRYTISVKLDQLAQYKLSMAQVYGMIQRQTSIIPAGSLQTENGKLNVQVPKAVNSLKDVENLILTISPQTGAPVRIGDVADVALEEVKGDLYYKRGDRTAVMLTARFNDDRNVVLIGKEVRRVVDALKGQYPDALNIDEVLFQPEDVSVAINDFVVSLLQGIGFVIVVVFVGMGLRSAAVVSVAIPLSLAMTIIVMGFVKVELHQVSIAALIIALGMLVDNAIVISDAIQEYLNAGLNKVDACFRGAREQAIPVLTSTLTTVVAFLPLMSLPSSAGEFLSSLPLVVIVSLMDSFIVAMLVTPSLASMSLKANPRGRDFIAPFRTLYTWLLNGNLKRPVFSLVVVLFLVLGSGALFTTVDMRLFPFVDKDIVYINIQNEVSGDIGSTEALMEKARKLLVASPEIVDVTQAVGGGLPRFYMTADLVMPSEANAQLLAHFDLGKGGRFKTRAELLYALQVQFDAEFVGGYATVNMLEINMPGATIEARIAGDDPAAMQAVSQEIYDYLLARKDTMNVQIKQPNSRYGYALNVDHERALEYGLTQYDIQSQLNMALNGIEVASIVQGDQSIPIFLKGAVKGMGEVGDMYIQSTASGRGGKVEQFARIGLSNELDVIRRFNRQTVISVLSDVHPQYGSASVQEELEGFVNTLDLSSVDVSFGGDQETMTRYLSGLAVAAAFAIAGIFIILMIQFNSLLQPLIILATVPLALIGVVVALVITHTNFSFTVGLGAASLSGVVVNNAILLIEYINRARQEGMSVIDACRDSVGKRMRPILLTTVTTVFGLVPLLFADSSFFTPMAIALMGGLMVSTFMTLTVIPTLYYALSKFEGKKVA